MDIASYVLLTIKYILLTVGFIFLFVLALLAILLIIPLNFKIFGKKESENTTLNFQFNILKKFLDLKCLYKDKKLRVVFNIAGFNVIKKSLDLSEIESEEKKEKEKIKKIKEKRDSESILKYKGKKKLLQKLVLMIKRIFKVLKPKEFRVKGTIGMESPDQTGLVLAFIGIFNGIFNSFSNIDIEGDFEDKRLDGKFSVVWRFSLGSLVMPVVKFAFSFIGFWLKNNRYGLNFIKGKWISGVEKMESAFGL